MSSDGQDRTEKATPQRMKEVRREGRLSRSQDLTAWVGLGAAALMLPAVATNAWQAAREQLAGVRDVVASPDAAKATAMLGDGLWSVVGTLTPMFAVVVVTIVVTAAAQGGIHPKKLKPEFKQFNLASGAKRLFGGQAWWQGIKTLLKTAAVALVVYMSAEALVPLLLTSGQLPLQHQLAAAGSGIKKLLQWGIAAGVALSLVDLVVVLRRNRKSTRMTLREVKDEHKRTEGDPLLKGAIRSKQMAMSRNRMMAAVADADVVVVNPTHVAVALRYVPGTGAPRVVAKGAGAVAARIRAEATERRVPMVEDIPLARALHAACALDQEVPAYLFTAVARVLAFVMALKRRGAAVGQHRIPGGSVAPADLPDTPVAARRRARAERLA